MANKRQKSIELGLTKQDSGRDTRAVLELTAAALAFYAGNGGEEDAPFNQPDVEDGFNAEAENEVKMAAISPVPA